MKLIRGILTLILLAAAVSATTAYDFTGLDAAALANKISTELRPAVYVGNPGIRDIVARYSKDEYGRYADYFSDKTFSDIDELTMLRVAPDKWWAICDDAYAGHNNDLHNILPAHSIPEADPATIPENIKGDIARIYMYMAVMYPATLWGDRAAVLYADGGWPHLNTYGRKSLMEWHREDPVDQRELDRDRTIAQVQGNSNPFVADELLAEYIWGTHSGESYPAEGSDPEQPDEPEAPSEPDIPSTELKGQYSISNDKAIFLRSPYVPSDATWTLDGKAVTSKRINLADDIAVGRHELKYYSPTAKGQMIITIIQ